MNGTHLQYSNCTLVCGQSNIMIAYIGAEVPNLSIGLPKSKHSILKAVYICNIRSKGLNFFFEKKRGRENRVLNTQ